jgi:hypothetical protein
VAVALMRECYQVQHLTPCRDRVFGARERSGPTRDGQLSLILPGSLFNSPARVKKVHPKRVGLRALSG